MQIGYLILGFVFLIPIGIAGLGVFNSYRSYLLMAVNLLVACPAALAAWYSWMEARSVGWASSYGFLAMVALGAAARQLILPSGDTEE